MEPDIREDSEVRNESGLAEAQRISISSRLYLGYINPELDKKH